MLRLEEVLEESEEKLSHYATYMREQYEAFNHSPVKAGAGGTRKRPCKLKPSANNEEQAAASSALVVDAYAEAMKEYRFASIKLLDDIMGNRISFSLKPDISHAVIGSAQKRLVRIMHEISSLSTGLPVEYGAGIYCRG